MRALSMSNRKRKDGMSSWIKILEVVVIFYGDEKEKIDGGRRVWRTRDIARYNSLSSFIFLGLSIAIRTRCTKPPSLALLLLCGCTPLPAAQIALKADENHSDFFFLPHFLYTNNCLPVPILLFLYILQNIYMAHFKLGCYYLSSLPSLDDVYTVSPVRVWSIWLDLGPFPIERSAPKGTNVKDELRLSREPAWVSELLWLFSPFWFQITDQSLAITDQLRGSSQLAHLLKTRWHLVRRYIRQYKCH